MAGIKKATIPWSETGIIVYMIVRRQVDSYRLDDADGNFASAPADPYIALTEDAVLKGVYEKSESRRVWNDGDYFFMFYKQAGGSPAPVSDMLIGYGTMEIIDDAEPAGDDSAAIAVINSKIDTMQLDVTDIHDESLGKWEVDPTGKTLTLYRVDGVTVLKVFNLTSTATVVPDFITRTPA